MGGGGALVRGLWVGVGGVEFFGEGVAVSTPHRQPPARGATTGAGVVVAVAAGLDDTTFGTDAAQIVDAITTADQGVGVVVLMIESALAARSRAMLKT